MFKTNFNIGTCVVAAALVGVPTANAQEDDFFVRDKYEAVTERAQPEFDPVPVLLGTFEARPQVDIGAGYRTNVFFQDVNEEEDTFFSLVPRVDIQSLWGRHGLGIDAYVDHVEFTDLGDESRTNFGANLDGRIDASSQVTLFGRLSAEELREPRSAAASVVGAEEPIEISVFGANAGAQYQSGRIRVRGGAGVRDSDYENGRFAGTNVPILQDFRDNTETTFDVRTSYAVERDLAVFAEALYIDREYDSQQLAGALVRDSQASVFRVGSDFELQSLLRGDIAIGFHQYEYDETRIDDVDGLSVEGSLSWFVSRLTTITAGAERTVVDPGTFADASATYAGVDIRADHELRRNLLVFGAAEFGSFDFETTNRNDDRYDIIVGGTWKLNRNAWLEASYRYTDQDSDFQEFQDNQVLFALRLFP